MGSDHGSNWFVSSKNADNLCQMLNIEHNPQRFLPRLARTGLGVYTGQQVWEFITRCGGTVLGLVLGMVVWYIGAGKGNGSPYGIAAASIVFMAPFMYARISLPQAKATFFLMTGVTVSLFIIPLSNRLSSSLRAISRASSSCFPLNGLYLIPDHVHCRLLMD